jgi:hypothetical protein
VGAWQMVEWLLGFNDANGEFDVLNSSRFLQRGTRVVVSEAPFFFPHRTNMEHKYHRDMYGIKEKCINPKNVEREI